MLVLAPAKVNLTLDVLGRRPDGYHEIRSVVQTVNLFDEIAVERSHALEVESPIRPAAEDLVRRAAERFFERVGKPPRVRITVVKKIPVGAGLGGGSSDAAATLRLLNAWEGDPLPPDEIGRLAADLGSDVPFFLVGGSALMAGRGEVVTALPPLPATTLILFVPPFRLATGAVYAAFARTARPRAGGTHTERFLAKVRRGRPGEALGNDLFPAAASLEPRLAWLGRELRARGVTGLTLTGSGSCLFAPLGRDLSEAVRFARQEGVEVFLVSYVRRLPPVGRWLGETSAAERVDR
jgi:4-diphosphocytidyl-2-C-methyl-D-erythritol kinase